MRLYSTQIEEARENTARLNSMRESQDFRYLGESLGVPQGTFTRPRMMTGDSTPFDWNANWGNDSFDNRSGLEGNSNNRREINTLIRMMDELQDRNEDLQRRLRFAEEFPGLTDFWRQQAGDINVDLNELCEAIRRGLPHSGLLRLVEEIDRRQRRRFGDRERRLSAVQYRDSDEETDYDDMPALITPSGRSSPELPAVGNRNDVDGEEQGVEAADEGSAVNRLFAISADRDREFRSAICPKEVRPERVFKCMTVYVELNGMKALALLDSRSSIDCVSPDFAKVAKLKPQPLAKPVALQLGCVGSRSTINFGTRDDVTIAGHREKVYLDIVNIDHYDLILGVPFLQQFGVILDFGNDSIGVKGTSIPSLPVASQPTSLRIRRAPTGTAAKYQWAAGNQYE